MIINSYGKEKDYREEAGILGHLFLRMTRSKMFTKIHSRYVNYLKEKPLYQSCKKETEEYFKKYYDRGKYPLFSSVELEIINRCNGECSFCPVNRYIDPRRLKKMDVHLFHKIIDELGELGYAGRLALHSNNEPFLDSRIIEFAQYAREHVPHAYIYMFTNGTLLTMEKFRDIIPYLNKLIIDHYDDDLKLSKGMEEINRYCQENPDIDRKVEIHLRKVNEVLNTRGGQSPNNERRETLNMSCVLPFKQMVIRPDGKTSLCCNDPYGRNTMADLNRMTLKEAWYSERYIQVRKELRKGRSRIKLCRYCDTKPSPKVY